MPAIDQNVEQLQNTPTLLNGERLIGLFAAARCIPGYRDNSHLSPSTIFRWIVNGTKTADGTRVKLEAVRLGNRWLTSAESIARYCAACSATPTPTQPTLRSPSARTRAAAAAAKELDELGIR